MLWILWWTFELRAFKRSQRCSCGLRCTGVWRCGTGCLLSERSGLICKGRNVGLQSSHAAPHPRRAVTSNFDFLKVRVSWPTEELVASGRALLHGVELYFGNVTFKFYSLINCISNLERRNYWRTAYLIGPNCSCLRSAWTPCLGAGSSQWPGNVRLWVKVESRCQLLMDGPQRDPLVTV
jgi:hypothetical protein